MSNQMNNSKRALLVLAILCVSLFSGISAQAASVKKSDFQEGVAAYQRQAYAIAASYFRTHISASPSGNAPAYYYLASCYVKMDRAEEAQKFYRHCLELRPDATMARYCQAALVGLEHQVKVTKPTTVASSNTGIATFN